MKKLLNRLILLLLLPLVIFACVVTKKGYDIYKEAISEKSIEQKISEIKSEKTHYVTINELPDKYVSAVVSVEDVRFFKHHGIDIVSIIRAIITDIKMLAPAEGGSTITQQLAKNVYFSQRKELSRKVAEMFMAIEIEKNCSKDEIFELYINTIYYGNGYYSIYDASQGYFGKEPKDMDLNEVTLLAGIPNAPSKYSPSVNPELAKQRQKQVINKMVKYKYLTKEEAEELLTKVGVIKNQKYRLARVFYKKEHFIVGV